MSGAFALVGWHFCMLTHEYFKPVSQLTFYKLASQRLLPPNTPSQRSITPSHGTLVVVRANTNITLVVTPA